MLYLTVDIKVTEP